MAVSDFDVFKIFFCKIQFTPHLTTVLNIFSIFQFKYLCIRADISSISVCQLLLAPGMILSNFSCKIGGISSLIDKTQKSNCSLDSCRYTLFRDPFYHKSCPYLSLISQGGHVGRIWPETNFGVGSPLVEYSPVVTRRKVLSPFFFGFYHFLQLFHPLNDIGCHINGSQWYHVL